MHGTLSPHTFKDRANCTFLFLSMYVLGHVKSVNFGAWLTLTQQIPRPIMVPTCNAQWMTTMNLALLLLSAAWFPSEDLPWNCWTHSCSPRGTRSSTSCHTSWSTPECTSGCHMCNSSCSRWLDADWKWEFRHPVAYHLPVIFRISLLPTFGSVFLINFAHLCGWSQLYVSPLHCGVIRVAQANNAFPQFICEYSYQS